MSVAQGARGRLLAGGAIVALAIVCYVWSLDGVFLLDDATNIVRNPWLRHLWPPGPALWSVPFAGLDGRPVVAFSFALQNELFGLGARPSHAINLAIHALNGLLILAIARRALRDSASEHWSEVRSDHAAFAIAALWTVHPLCTAAVTYVVQRCESLAALFFLLAFHAAQRALLAPRSRAWTLAAGLAAWLAVGSKEHTAVLPLVVLVYVIAVRREAFAPALKTHTGLFVALASSWLGFAALIHFGGAHSEAVGLGHGVGAFEYAEAQTVAILSYLRLSFWPHPLVFDYGCPPVESAAQWLLAGAAVIALVVLSVRSVVRREAAGFLGMWFFLILAPSSSFLPLSAQFRAEHRMYLSLAAVIAGVVVCASGLRALRGLPPLAARVLLGACIAALAGRTIARNLEYRSAEGLWRQSLAHAPGNARAHDELATLLRAQGKADEARAELAEAVRLQPEESIWRSNYGASLWEAGDLEGAEAQLRKAVELRPVLAMGHSNLGRLLRERGRFDEAETELRAAMKLQPEWPRPRRELAFLLADLRRHEEAATELKALLRMDPADEELARKLILQLATTPTEPAKNGAEAVRYAEQVLARMSSPTAGWLAACAAAYAQAGRYDRAIELQQRAVELERAEGAKFVTTSEMFLELYRTRKPRR